MACERTEPPVKKGICLGCLPPDLDDLRRMKLAREAGFDGVEINTPASDGQAEDLRAMAEQAGIEIHSVMDSLHWECPLSDPDDAVRRRGMESLKASIRAAKITGATAVLVVPGVVNDTVSYEQAWERSMAGLKELAPYAAEHGVPLCVENVWNRFLLSPREMVEFIDTIGSPSVQAYFDVGNIVLYGNGDQWLRSLGARVRKIHLKDFSRGEMRFVYLFQGDVPWQRIMHALAAIGYRDYLTAEMGPYRGCPGITAFDISRHIDHLFGMV